MKSANLKLEKIKKNSLIVDSVKVSRSSGEILGFVLCSGEFVSEDSISLYISEVQTILNIMENFPLFFDNINLS